MAKIGDKFDDGGDEVGGEQAEADSNEDESVDIRVDSDLNEAENADQLLLLLGEEEEEAGDQSECMLAQSLDAGELEANGSHFERFS